MDAQPELFDSGPAAPIDVAPEAADLGDLAARVPRAIHLGTSSWTFPGWAGLVYDRTADPRTLARHGLRAYARHPLLRCVGVDRTYYEPLPAAVFTEWAEAVPHDFRFVVKATRDLVTPGEPAFLDAAVALERAVAPAVEGLGPKLGAVLFQFPPTPTDAAGGPRRFAEALYRLLRDLPSTVPIAVEIRTPGWYTSDYRAALAHGGATHGWVVHPRMIDLAEQRSAGEPEGEGPTVIRWMLAPEARYEEAREAWAPFDRMQAPDPSNRRAVADLARVAANAGGPVYVVVNNKAEGSSPASVAELARLLAPTP